MKTLIATSLLALSFSSMAATCFKPEKMPSDESRLPARICVEDFSVKLVIPELPQTPFYEGMVVTSAGTATKKVNFIETRDKTFKVSLGLPMVEIDNGACGNYYKSDLVVEFDVDRKAKAINESLTVYATEHETYDLCHSNGSTTVIKYNRI